MGSLALQKKSWHGFIFVLFILVSLLVMAGNVLFVWVATGPRSISRINPYIEKALSPPGGEFHVDIGETWLTWNGWQNPLDIRAKRVQLKLPNNEQFAEFPEISLALDIPSLLLAKIQVSKITIFGATITLQQMEDGGVHFGLNQNRPDSTLPIEAGVAAFTGRSSGGRSTVDNVVIRQASLTLKNKTGANVISTQDVQLVLLRKENEFTSQLSMILEQDKNASIIHAKLGWDMQSRRFGISSFFSGLRPAMLDEFMPLPAPLKGFFGSISGSLAVSGTLDGGMNAARFSLETQNAFWQWPETFTKPVEINHALLQGITRGKPDQIILQKAKLVLNKTPLNARGEFLLSPDKPAYFLIAEAKGMPVEDLERYWPLQLTGGREWVMNNIKGGVARSGEITLNLQPGDILQPGMPDYALAATVDVEGTTLRYMPDHDVIKNLDAIIRFSGKGMWVDVTSGSYLSGTTVKSAHLEMPDLHAHVMPMLLQLNLATRASDIAAVLAKPDINVAKDIGLVPGAIQGFMEGTLELALNITPDSGILTHYKTEGKISGVSQQKLLGKYDIKNANGDLMASTEGASFSGTAEVSEVPLAINAAMELAADRSVKSQRFAAKGQVPDTKFAEFGLPVLPMVKGSAGLDVKSESAGGAEKVSLGADLTAASVTIPEIGWTKEKGKPASLALSLQRFADKRTLVDAFNLVSEKFKARGSAAFSGEELQAARIDELTLGRNNLSALLQKKGTIAAVELKGESLDLSQYLNGSDDSSFSTDKFIDVELKASLAKIYLKDDQILTDTSAILNCTKICTSAVFAGNASGKPFRFTIANENGRRGLTGSAENAGSLLRAFDIYQNMNGGTLSLKGSFDDNSASHPLTGTLRIRDYELVKAPVLARMLSLASITAIGDTLQGKGVAFKYLRAPFTMANDVITLKESKAAGNSMGITAEGSIDLKKKRIDVKGILVPSYSLNTMVDKIPVIGQVLTGGKGKGLFAVNYKMQGPLKEPELSINPLSILTPGFLRNIFDVFDAPAETGAAPEGKANGNGYDMAPSAAERRGP